MVIASGAHAQLTGVLYLTAQTLELEGCDVGYRDRYELVDENDPDWKRFWDRFPRRVAKKEARRAWAQMKPTPYEVEKMLEALEWQCAQADWLKDGGRFVPYPASWLRAARWEDEPPAKSVKVMSDAAALVFETLGVKP